MRKFIMVLAVLCCSILARQGYAQEKNDTTYRVATADGNEYVGKIVGRDADGITLNTSQLGNITIKNADIRKMTYVGNVRMENGKYYFDNPQASKYFFAQNGYGVKKGEGYYSNVWIFFNEFTYGVSDHFSISAGIIPMFLFGVATPVWINPKLSIPVVKDKFNLGIGAYAGTVIGEDNTGFAFLYGNSTFGSRDKNVTLGLGWGYAGGEMSKTPLVTLAGMLRISQRWYLLTENQFLSLPDADGLTILSAGARYAARRVGIDFGLFVPIEEGISFFAAPWLGINVPFGRKK
jgi:hypothetical protein